MAQNPKISTFFVSSCSCRCPIYWSQVSSRKWRCSWSSADRLGSNYMYNRVINDFHYDDVIMDIMASQITGHWVVCFTLCLSQHQRKHQGPRYWSFVRKIHRWPVNFPHKGPVTRKMFPFDDVIMIAYEGELILQVWRYTATRKPLIIANDFWSLALCI